MSPSAVGWFKGVPLGDSVANVQYGTISISGSTSNTATIASVDTTKSVVMYLGMNQNFGGTPSFDPYLVLTNATTVTATRGTNNASATVASFVVITFSATPVSLQTGTTSITSTNTSNTSTITSVNTSKAFIIYGGQAATTNDQTGSIALTLTNATTITATRDSASGNQPTTAAWAIVQF